MTIYMLPQLKCIRFVSVRSSFPCIYVGVRIELTFSYQCCDGFSK